jgi:hypothetical protein
MLMASLSIILGSLWLILAAVAFIMPYIQPQGSPWTFPGTQISIGWVALFLFGYNMAHWWGNRQRAAKRDTPRSSTPQRIPEEPANPDFDFSEHKPPEQP